MVDLNVLSEVGGFKHYLAKGLMGVLKHPKHPLNTPLFWEEKDHSLSSFSSALIVKSIMNIIIGL